LSFASVFIAFPAFLYTLIGFLHPIFGSFWQRLYKETKYFSPEMPVIADIICRDLEPQMDAEKGPESKYQKAKFRRSAKGRTTQNQ